MRSRLSNLLYQRLGMVAVALAVTFVLAIKGRQPAKTAGLTALLPSPSPSQVFQVSGDVAHPGMYWSSDKKMTNSVILVAKPLCAGELAKQPHLLSTPLQTGKTLHLLCKGPDNRAKIYHDTIKPSQLLTLGLPLDLNQVTAADLDLLPGIGPILASRIIGYRQKNGGFSGVHELLQVEGIGEKKYLLLNKHFK